MNQNTQPWEKEFDSRWNLPAVFGGIEPLKIPKEIDGKHYDIASKERIKNFIRQTLSTQRKHLVEEERARTRKVIDKAVPKFWNLEEDEVAIAVHAVTKTKDAILEDLLSTGKEKE